MVTTWTRITLQLPSVNEHGSRLSIIRAALASQNVTNNIPREKPEKGQPCLGHKLKDSNRAKEQWIPSTTFNNSNNNDDDDDNDNKNKNDNTGNL